MVSAAAVFLNYKLLFSNNLSGIAAEHLTVGMALFNIQFSVISVMVFQL